MSRHIFVKFGRGEECAQICVPLNVLEGEYFREIDPQGRVLKSIRDALDNKSICIFRDPFSIAALTTFIEYWYGEDPHYDVAGVIEVCGEERLFEKKK